MNIENMQDFWWVTPAASWRVNLQIRENILDPVPGSEFFEGKGSYGLGTQAGPFLFYALMVATENGGQNLPQANLELGPELGFLTSGTKIKAYASVSAGDGVFESASNQYVKASGGIGWFFDPRFSLNQENEWSSLLTKNLYGYRTGLTLKGYF